jgi:hypothetical protein
MAGNKDRSRDHDIHLPNLEHHEVRHEDVDVNVWAIGKFGIALALLCIVSMGLLFGLYRYFEAQNGGPVEEPHNVPPEPRLQVHPVQDLRAIREQEDQILNSYGWVDPQHTVVRIPIARAIDLIAKRGLPVSAPPHEGSAAASEVSVPTESGLGPKVQQPGGPLADELNRTGGSGAPSSPAARPGGVEK